MNGFRIYQLCPSPFFWLGLLKNSLKKTKFLNTNLWASSTCREKGRLEDELQLTVMKRATKLGRVHTG